MSLELKYGKHSKKLVDWKPISKYSRKEINLSSFKELENEMNKHYVQNERH
jgi:hypothetical protein